MWPPRIKFDHISAMYLNLPSILVVSEQQRNSSTKFPKLSVWAPTPSHCCLLLPSASSSSQSAPSWFPPPNRTVHPSWFLCLDHYVLYGVTSLASLRSLHHDLPSIQLSFLWAMLPHCFTQASNKGLLQFRQFLKCPASPSWSWLCVLPLVFFRSV